jgi:hypothetical protein
MRCISNSIFYCVSSIFCDTEQFYRKLSGGRARNLSGFLFLRPFAFRRDEKLSHVTAGPAFGSGPGNTYVYLREVRVINVCLIKTFNLLINFINL